MVKKQYVKKHKTPETTPDALTPHNIEAEEALIGSLLLDSSLIRQLNFLSGKDFFVEKWGWVYDTILHLDKNNISSDLVTLSDELERRKYLYQIGGAMTLANLINATPTSAHFFHYAKIVERTSLLRKLIDAASRIAVSAYEDQSPVDEIITEAHRVIKEIKVTNNTNILTMSDVIGMVSDEIDAKQSQDWLSDAISTGLTDLDTILDGGFYPSRVYVIGGRPGMGKSAIAMNMGLHAAINGFNILVFSYEMSATMLVKRLISSLSGIDSKKLKTGLLDDDEWPLFLEACNKLSKCNIFIADTINLTISEMKNIATKLNEEIRIDEIIIDYFGLIKPDKKTANAQEDLSTISREIVSLAMEMNTRILLLSQLSREVEKRNDKRPLPSDLRGSGSLEQDAFGIIFIYRDDVYDEDSEFPNQAEAIVAKHRDGSTGKAQIYFNKLTVTFTDLAEHTEDY